MQQQHAAADAADGDAAAATPAPETALELLHSGCFKALAFGDARLDAHLGGGLRPGITEVAGEAGCGKTHLALHFALQAQLPEQLGGLNGEAVFISTEGDFPSQRLVDMSAAFKARHSWTRQHDYGSHVFVERAASLDELDRVLHVRLPALLLLKRVRLVVLDSIAALFRECGAEEYGRRAEALSRVAAHLLRVSGQYGCHVLVTNHVTDVVDGVAREQQPLDGFRWRVLSSGRYVQASLGLAWAQCVTTRIMLARTRRAEEVLPDEAEEPEAKSADRAAPNPRGVSAVRALRVIFSPYIQASRDRLAENADAADAVEYTIERGGVRVL